MTSLAKEDPLLVEIEATYNLTDLEKINLEVSNPKVLLSAEIWLLLIAKEKLVAEDLWTSRCLDGAYIMQLRLQLIELFPSVFGNNKGQELREELIGNFRIIAQTYITASGVRVTKADAPAQAHLLVQQVSFLVKRASELCLKIEETIVSGARGAKVAQHFRQSVLELNPERFSLRSEAAAARAAKNPGGSVRDHDDSDRGDDRRKNQKPKKEKLGGKGRKCIRCQAGPFTFKEFQEHNRTCKK